MFNFHYSKSRVFAFQIYYYNYRNKLLLAEMI